MYPNFYYVFKSFFDVSIPQLKFINTFGFFVALGFIVSSIFISKELKRKEKLNFFKYSEEEIIVGTPASIWDLIINFFVGFVLGFKLIAIFFGSIEINNPQEYIFSMEGNPITGLITGITLAAIVYYQKKKNAVPKPEKRIVRIWPSDRVSEIVVIAILWGIIGAKIFNSLETWDDFVKDPIRSLISFGGLTFYGGLIVATFAICIYAKKKKINVAHLADTICLVLLLAYGIGRLGCHFSGDGDWGIIHNTPNPYNFIPDWLWSNTYPNNVINEGVPMANCFDDHCRVLPYPVYPTSLYEAIINFILFIVLWFNRTKFPKPLQITGIYCVLNGLERFFIEKIRVNYKYEFLPFHPTQAELISVILIILGIGIFLYATFRNQKSKIKN